MHLRIGIALSVLALGAVAGAAEREVDPTFLRRNLENLTEVPTAITTSNCRYYAIFGEGAPYARVARSLARFGEIRVDPGGSCATVTHAREEEVYIVLEGEGVLHYSDQTIRLRTEDYVYLPPTIPHFLSNPGQHHLRVLVLGYRIPSFVAIHIPDSVQLANIQEVPPQVVAGHPPSVKYRLLMGTRESKRDRIAAAHVLTSLFIMEFEPGGTNFPHHHEREEELYLLLSGEGQMVAGGGMDGFEGRHPARAGDAYFFRLNCTVGFYASSDARSPRARILAARSLFPFRPE